MKSIKVLWIEDGSRYDLPALAAPLLADERYALNMAEDASAGISRLLAEEYHVVVVDIRIPPGESAEWIALHQKCGVDQAASRLGLHLLYSILRHPAARISVPDGALRWLGPNRIGVFTVEGRAELSGDLEELGIGPYQQKSASLGEDALLVLVQQVLTVSGYREVD